MLGRAITTGEEITLPPDNLHTYIIGNTGVGKTSLERSLIADVSNAGHGVCVIDPHGERDKCLVDLVLSDLPRKRLKDVILFDVNDPRYVPGLKPFYCRDKDELIAVQDTMSTALNMFEKVYNVDRNTMARIIAYIESLIYLFIFDDSLTLLDIPNLLNPDIKYDKKRLVAASHLPPSPGYNFTRDFWTEEYSRRAKRGYNQDSEIFGTLMKFRELSSHLLWPMFCQHKNTLDLRVIMQQQKILLVKLNGNWEDITSLLGTYIIGQIKDAAFHRSLKDPPFYLYVDEFQRMASRDFLTLFSEARGGNVHVTIDHQVATQLDEEMKETIRQASTFVCFQTTDITAASIARMFDTTPPPGEWIYEKIMRKATKPYQVPVRDSPEAEAEYLALGEKIEQSKELISSQDHTYGQLPALRFYPIRMTPNLRQLVTSLQHWFRPCLDSEDVAAYMKSLYEHRTSFSFTYKRYSHDYQYSYYRDFSGKYHMYKGYVHRNKDIPFTYYAIKPHITTNTQYRFPLQFPCEFETGRWSYNPPLLEELKTTYQPFKCKAYYHFDVAEYERNLALGDLHGEPSAPTFYEPWKGPYLPESDWLSIIKWIYDKTNPKQEAQLELSWVHERRQYLERTYWRMETRYYYLGWMEPEPVLEWEELSYLKSVARWNHQELLVGDNCKYRARLGNPPYGSDEVANRIANQIKQLDKFIARVRITSGEYTIATIAPKEQIQAKSLKKRIEQVYQQNLKDGFLKLRLDVEKAFTLLSPPQHQGNGHTPQQPVPLPTPRRK